MLISQDTALVPVRAATSKSAQRAYLGTLLFAFSTTVLFSLSALAFILFYNSYVPHIGVEKPIHLEFSCAPPHHEPYAQS